MTARAQLTIEISQGVDNPTAIAVVPFAWQGVGAPPEDVAGVVSFLASKDASFITAETIQIGGGQALGI